MEISDDDDCNNNTTPIDLSLKKSLKLDATTTIKDQCSTPQQQLTRKYVLIQKQLGLLLHAASCCSGIKKEPSLSSGNNIKESNNTTCNIPYCATMKQVLVHLRSCSYDPAPAAPPTMKELESNNKCIVQYCMSSKQILSHWKSCSSSNSINCLICGSINKSMGLRLKRKSKEEFKVQFNNTRLLWSGVLQWRQSSSTAKMIQLSTQVFCNNKSIMDMHWPSSSCKLSMKLIPVHLFYQFEEANYWSNAKVEKVLIEFKPCKEVETLKQILKSKKYYGYLINIDCMESTSTTTSNGVGVVRPVKLIILQYDPELDSCIGYIPKAQKWFMEKLRNIVREEIIIKSKGRK